MARLPKSIIKKYGITKKAWAVFRSGRSSSSRKARHHSRIGGKIRKMARRRRRWFGRARHRARQGFNLRTVEKLIGIGAFAAPGLQRGKDVWDSYHDPVRAVTEAAAIYAGVKAGQFSVDTLKEAWTPFVAFTLIRVGVHKITGMIRKL